MELLAGQPVRKGNKWAPSADKIIKEQRDREIKLARHADEAEVHDSRD
jgi:hypothetical protein